jgi:hypothetical protein
MKFGDRIIFQNESCCAVFIYHGQSDEGHDISAVNADGTSDHVVVSNEDFLLLMKHCDPAVEGTGIPARFTSLLRTFGSRQNSATLFVEKHL